MVPGAQDQGDDDLDEDGGRRALTIEELHRLVDAASGSRLILIDLCGRNGLRLAEAWVRLPCPKVGIEPAITPYEPRHTAINLQADAGRSSWEIADWARTSEATGSRIYRHRLRRLSTLQPADRD